MYNANVNGAVIPAAVADWKSGKMQEISGPCPQTIF